MEDKILELLTEEERKLHDEFTRCETMEEIEELEKKWNRLNESQDNNVIPHYDMTLEEFRAKYHTTSYEEMRKQMWGCDEMTPEESADWTPSQWAAYLTKGQTFDEKELDRFIEEEIIEK